MTRDEPPAAIGLVDGVLPPEPSISAKEVLRAIDLGIPVFGAAGIGALRAVECDQYGMVGVGRSYEAYRSEWLDADDEVLRADQPPSEPLANLRFAVAATASAGATTADTAQRFMAIAKALHYPQRTIAAAAARALAEEIGPVAVTR